MQTAFLPTSALQNLGHSLRAQRLSRHLGLDDVSRQLNLPVAVVDAMERADTGILGPAVFARGRLGSYARLVGVPVVVVDACYPRAPEEPPALVGAARGSRLERSLLRVARRGIYVVLTAIAVLPVVWLATHDRLPQASATLSPLDSVPLAATTSDVSPQAGPVSIATTTARTSGTGQGAGTHQVLQLRFSGDSAVDVTGADGRSIEHAMVDAGSVRNYAMAAIARVQVANPAAVVVFRDGAPVDLSAFRNTNGIGFTLSSAGELAPAGN